MKMYCITIYDDHYDKIKNFGYTPVGLGKNIKSKKFLTDNKNENIALKNSYYGEYTFHYWLWKNEINNLKNEWIGFCQYRKYWSLRNIQKDCLSIDRLDQTLLKHIPKEYESYETILGEPLFINQFKFSKFIKKKFCKNY
ncbi:DUF4422 domain-containing protein [Pelagibacteraceae bacterium]|nr:DUF4422 domain-containing protein [Pelagibacteraceae bacterium]